MNEPVPAGLRPRKDPRQERSAATVDAIFEATIQVLLAQGPAQLTTTRVAQRAGVSVGTLYQYFPHKQALLFAALQRHLAMVAETVEAACREQEGRALSEMADALVAAFVRAKTARSDVSVALYMVAAQLDSATVIASTGRRIETATATMLASARDARFADLPSVTLTVLAALSGAVRTLFERDTPPPAAARVHAQLAILCRAYLEAVALAKDGARLAS